MKRLIGLLQARLGVLTSWASVGRIAVWSVVWAVIVSFVVALHVPTREDREIQADVPPSGVRYVGPSSQTDFAGFLPPEHDPAAFTVAWVGGSEVKLREISVPGAFEQRVATVGGRPLLVDSYNVIAPRIIDAIRAIDTAAGSGADAIVVSLNPAWVRTEWSLRGWDNLDVSNLGTLWSRSATWSWALGLTAPDDYAWRLARAALPIVEAQTRLNQRARDSIDWLDVLESPEADSPVIDIDEADAGDPRLPPDDGVWLVDHYGTAVMADEDARVAALIGGIGVSQEQAEFFARVLIDEVEQAGVPVFLYAAPFAPESLAKPEFDARAIEVEQYWTQIGESIESDLVELEPRSLSRFYDSTNTFANNVHMYDTSRFADVLVERLCAQWAAADPTMECA